MTKQAKIGNDAREAEPAVRGPPFMAAMGLLVGLLQDGERSVFEL